MLFLLFLNVIFLRFPFGVLPPGDYLPALVEPVFDTPFDVSLVLPTSFDLGTLEPSKTDVFAPQALPDPDQYFLTKCHHAVLTSPLATPTDRSSIAEVTFTMLPAQESDSSEILRLVRSDGVEFISIRESAATDGYVDRNLLYDLKTEDMGKPPFLTYSTFDIIVACLSICHVVTLVLDAFCPVIVTFLTALCHIITTKLYTSKKYNELVQRHKEQLRLYKELVDDASYHCSQAADANEKLGDCQAELAKLQESRKQNHSELSDLQRQYSELEKELAKATQEAKKQDTAHAQELSKVTQQKVSLEADQQAKSELIDEQAQALQAKDAELVEYKAQANKAEKLDIDMQQLESALQKKNTELSSYKVKAHKAEKLDQSLQQLKNVQKNRDVDMAKLSKENKAFKKSEASLQEQVANLTKEKADAILETDRERSLRVKAEGASMSETAQLKKSEANLQAQVVNLAKGKADAMLESDRQNKAFEKSEASLRAQVVSLTKEKADAILEVERQRSFHLKAQGDSTLKVAQLQKDLTESKEEAAMYKKDMEQMKADAEAQKKTAAIVVEVKKRAMQSNLSRMEKLVGSAAERIDDTVQKNRMLAERFEERREERIRASPWHTNLASSDKEDVAQENKLLEPKTEQVSTVELLMGSPRPDSDQPFKFPRETPSPTDQSTDSGFYDEVKSRIDQFPSTIDATTIPDTFSADSVLHSENEPQVKFPEKDEDISAPQETVQSQTLSNLLRPQHNLEAKTMLPQGISALQLPGTVIIRQTGSTVFIVDDSRRREPWLRKEGKAYQKGSLRARKNWHKDTIAASVKYLGLKFAESYMALTPGEKAFHPLSNFKGSRRRHSLSYGEKDSVIMAKIKDPRIPRTDTPELPCECAWLSSNVLEEISTRASSRSGSSFDDTLHLKSIVIEGELDAVPASAVCQLNDDFFMATSRFSNQLSTIPRDEASYDEFKSARIVDIIGADNLRLMRQRLAYAESFSFGNNAALDKYRSTWSQSKEIRVESHDQKNRSKIADHLDKIRFDYSTESVQELLTATADVVDDDVGLMAQENERPKPLTLDINDLRRAASSGYKTHLEKIGAQQARSTVNPPSAPPTLSDPSSSTTTMGIATQSAPPAPGPQAQAPPPSRGVETSKWATKASTPPASSRAAQVASQVAPTTTAAPPRSLNSSRHASNIPIPAANPAPLTGSTATTSATPSHGVETSRWATEAPTPPSNATPSGPSGLPTAPFNGQNIPSGPRNHRGGRGYGRCGRGRGRERGFH